MDWKGYFKPSTNKIIVSLLVAILLYFLLLYLGSKQCAAKNCLSTVTGEEQCTPNYVKFSFLPTCCSRCTAVKDVFVQFFVIFFLPFILTYLIYSIVQLIRKK